MLSEILVVLGLILINGILSGAEIAVVALRSSRVREMAESGSRAGQAVHRLRSEPERFLSTVQVGITVVSATAAAFSGTAFAADLAPLVARVSFLAARAEAIAFVLVVSGVSYLSIVLGELVPKSLALRTSERYALLVARPLLALSRLTKPAVWLLTGSSNAVLSVFGDRTSFTESKLSREELRGLVDEASQGGSVSQEAGEIASRALEFADLRAVDVMVHRRFVVGLPLDADPEVVRTVMLEKGHRRTPVFRGSLDNVAGYVSWRDVLRSVWESGRVELETLMRPCYFVPETMAAGELMGAMRSQRLHLAVVVDEHGGMAGIVTLEDLLEELVGEIVSEHDKEPSHAVALQADGSALVAGTANIRDVNRALEIELEEGDEWGTINGLCIALAGGRIPGAGETFEAPGGIQIEIVDATMRRVRMVRIRHAAPVPEDGEASAQ